MPGRKAKRTLQVTEDAKVSGALTECFLDHNPYAVLICDEEGCVVGWNQALAAMEERPGDLERLRMDFRPLEDPQLHEQGVCRLLQKALEGEWIRVPPFEWIPERSGFAGTSRVLQGVAFPMEAGEPDPKKHICIMFRDVTEEESSRREQDEYQAVLHGLLNASHAAISFVDTGGTVRFANRYVEEFFGVDPVPFLGQPVERLIENVAAATGDPQATTARLLEIQGDPELEVDEFAEVLRPTRRHIHRYSGPVRQADGGILGRINVCTDETESFEQRKLLEQQNRELDAFASRLAHDFKTPLVSLKGFADLLERQCAAQLDDRGMAYLEKVQASAALLGEMVDGLRDLARAGEPAPCAKTVDPVPLLGLLRDSLFELAAQEGVTIETPRTAPHVVCEKVRLYEIFQNLLSNGIRYADREKPERWIRVGAEEEGTMVAFSVVDNGVGIPAADAAKLFRPFHRGSNAAGRSGMGLGLAITERIVKASGGQIRVESTPGTGTRFTVLLPRDVAREEA